MARSFNIGDSIGIEGASYYVSGKITYTDNEYEWDEYLIDANRGLWLSVDGDDVLLWEMTGKVDTTGLEVTDSGREIVKYSFGAAEEDVDPGESATYTEYYDAANNRFIAVEVWSDETEYSIGTKIDPAQITVLQQASEQYIRGSQPTKGLPSGCTKILGIGGIIAFIAFIQILCNSSGTDIKALLEKDSQKYTLETAITGFDNKVADVFTTDLTSEMTAMDIVDKLEGEVEYIQENPQDESAVAILTRKQLCMIYRDSIDQSTLVHVASREWTLDNLEAPLYDADSLTNDFYRGFYGYHAFASDTISSESDRHRHYHHHYGTYFGAMYLLSNSRYSTYSHSVREASAARRRSSGGGHGGGGK